MYNTENSQCQLTIHNLIFMYSQETVVNLGRGGGLGTTTYNVVYMYMYMHSLSTSPIEQQTLMSIFLRSQDLIYTVHEQYNTILTLQKIVTKKSSPDILICGTLNQR